MRKKRKHPVADEMAKARKRLGYSLRAVENFTGIDDATISQIELGHIQEPSFSVVVRLAVAYGLDIDDLACLVPI